MVDCTYCKKKIERGTGKLYITKQGKQFWYCSKKCEVNQQKLKRSPLKTNWVRKAIKKVSKKEEKAHSKEEKSVEAVVEKEEIPVCAKYKITPIKITPAQTLASTIFSIPMEESDFFHKMPCLSFRIYPRNTSPLYR